MFGYSFLGVKLCKCNVLDDPSSPQRYDSSPDIASDVILNPKILREYIAKKLELRMPGFK